MTTPAFVPQDSSSLTTVRYYTQFDPYYYTVDNRPLQDLAANITTISSGGGDSARRAVLLTQLGLSDVFRNLYTSSGSYVSGLAVSVPGSGTIQIGSGSLYFSDAVNASVSTSVLKQALLLAPVVVSTPLPVTTGQSIDYLIQIQSSALTSANMGTSALPFLDATNSFLPSLLLNSELKVGVKAGTSAATGSQVTPTADAGWTPLYVVTTTYGATNPSVKQATSAPSRAGINHTAPILYPSTGAATITNVNSVPVATFADGSTSSISVQVPTLSGSINPYAPIKVTLVASSSTNAGNSQVQLSYLALASGGSTGSAATSATAELVASPGTANTLTSYTMSATVPASAFAAFVGGNWVVTAQKLYLSISRNGSAGPDTNTGSLFIHDVIISQ